MSGGRIEVGVGAGWNELEHRQLGLPFPPIKERADLMEEQLAILHGPVGRAGRLVVRGPPGLDPRRAVPSEAGRRPRPADGRPIGGARPRLLVGGGRLAPLAADRRPLCGRVQPELVGDRTMPRDVFAAARRGVRGDRARPGDARPLDDGRRADRPRRGRDGANGCRRSWAFGDERGRARSGSTSAASAGSPARRTRPASRCASSRRRASERIMLQDFLPWDLDMIDLMGEALVGQL